MKGSVNKTARLFRRFNGVHIVVLASALLAALYTTPAASMLGFDIVRHRSGHVMARGLALSEDGNPVFVEYDSQGEEVNEIGEAVDERLDATVMSAERYRQIIARFNEIKEEGEESFARGATIISRDAYESQVTAFTTRDGEMLTGVPDLAENSLSVLVRHADQTLIPEISPILYEAPIDLNDAQDLDEDIVSVLLSEDGRILHSSENNIGYRVDFFKDRDENPILRASEHDRVYEGIPNVPIETVSGFINGFGVTDENGAFSTTFLIAPCPGFFMDYTIPNYAKLRYRRFNPRGQAHGLFTLQSISYETCNGIGAHLAASGNLVGLMTYVNLLAIQATSATFSYPTNFYVDSAVISGQGFMANPELEAESRLSYDEPIPVTESGNTVYEYTAPDDDPIAQQNFDFDGDEDPDRSVLGDWQDVPNPETGETEQRFVRSDTGTLQGVYFSSGDGNPDLPVTDDLSQPDLVRLADKKEDFLHQGLLETISLDDLKETDLYVFRESNGMLITHRKGLRENELAQSRASQDGGVDDNSEIFYQFLVRGPRSNTLLYRDFSAFQSDALMNPELHERQSDHLRAQEPIKIIAINRRTGYIGTVSTEYMDYQNNPGLISFPIDKLIMRPPNLKVLAERKSRIEAGMTRCDNADCEDEYLIGYEGAATTNDTILTITTEWYDDDGSPLPEGLGEYGFTGRLAKVTGGNTLSTDGGQLAQFPIKPGRHLQTIRLRGDYDTSEHFYLQINGEPENESPDFSTLGAAESGPLQYRPKHYVPFLVPIEDQDATIRQYNAYRALRRDPNIPNDTLEDFGPVHKWFYRPEMQFSMYDLDMKNIFLEVEDENSEAIDIYPQEDPIIENDYDIVRLAYDLIEQQFQALPYLGPGQQLVFAFGEEEIAATLDEDANVVFTNIEHFAALDPEDFLSIRLYNNNDPGNVLWEFAFGADLMGQSDIEVVSADNNEIDLTAYLPIKIDENDLKNITVRWNVEGAGSLADVTTESQYGVFQNTLTTSTQAEASHVVTATVIASDDDRVTVGTEREFGPFLVEAGVPNRVELSLSNGSVLSSGVDTVNLTGEVYDQFDNPVTEGTPVTWEVGYSGDVEEIESVVGEGGYVSAKYRSGVELTDTVVTLLAGEEFASEAIAKNALDYTLSLSSSAFEPGQQGSVMVQLSEEPEEPLEVFWTSSHGQINGPSIISGTEAQAFFTIGNLGTTDGYVSVNIAGVQKEINFDVNLADEQGTIEFEFASIAAGDTDLYQVETLDSMISETVVRSTNATVFGTPGETVTLSAGGFYSQNYEPVVIFPMSGFDVNENNEQIVIDTIGGLNSLVQGDVFWDETESYILPGSSMRFEGGQLATADNDILDFNTDYYANVRFKVTEQADEAVLLRKGSNDSNGYELSLVSEADGLYLQARVSTNEGDFIVLSSTAVNIGEWYLGGLQLKNGVLTVGLNANRDAIPAPGTPNNTGFASNLIVGQGYTGFIDDIKIGQIDESRGVMALIDGEVEKEITFDSGGRATVSISGGTASPKNLGSRVGFSIVQENPVAHIHEKELKYRTALRRLTFFNSPVSNVYAQTSSSAQELEGGVAVVDGQAMAEAIDMLKKAGKPALDAIKTAAKFLFEMTSLSDLWQLSKAVYLWANGRFDEVDKIELAFAGIGLTLTIVTIAVTVGSGGTAGPGSIAAMVSVKAALKVLKGTLKEVFRREPAQLLRIGGTVVRWAFDLVKNLFTGAQGRQAAIRQLTDFKDIFIDLVTNGSAAAWGMLKSLGKSTTGFITFMKLRKLRNFPCNVAYNYGKEQYLFARLSPLSVLSPQMAHAAPLCGPALDAKIISAADDLGLSDIHKKELVDIAAKISKVDDEFAGAIRMSGDTVDNIAHMVKQGQGANIQKFLDNMEDAGASAMGGFRFSNMDEIANSAGDTAFDVMFAAMREMPNTGDRLSVDAYNKAFNQLATRNASNIRGVYGEAATFKRLKNEELVSGSGLRADPATLKVGDDVNYTKPNQQGVDVEGLLVDRSLTARAVNGKPLYVEVKNYTTNYKKSALEKQTKKHFRANILSELATDGSGWRNASKPHLHYEWMGEGFINPASGARRTDLIQRRKKTVIDTCKKLLKTELINLALASPAFDCETDITFNIVDELIVPLTAKAS